MAEVVTYRIQVVKFFVDLPVRQRKDKDKPVKVPIIQRTLFINVKGGLDFMPSALKIFQVRRNGETTYSLTVKPKVRQSIWENPSGRAEMWYKEGEDWVKDGKSMTPDEFLSWLTKYFGVRASLVMDSYLTTPPEEMAA